MSIRKIVREAIEDEEIPGFGQEYPNPKKELDLLELDLLEKLRKGLSAFGPGPSHRNKEMARLYKISGLEYGNASQKFRQIYDDLEDAIMDAKNKIDRYEDELLRK
jgi:hypothetical protein